MTRIVEALLHFNCLTDLQNCLEFPAGIVYTCDYFAFWSWDTTLLHSYLCLALRLVLLLNMW